MSNAIALLTVACGIWPMHASYTSVWFGGWGHWREANHDGPNY
jgi:hypothetical protein